MIDNNNPFLNLCLFTPSHSPILPPPSSSLLHSLRYKSSMAGKDGEQLLMLAVVPWSLGPYESFIGIHH